jgi:hypothetical protein
MNKILYLAISAIVLFSSCNDEDPKPVDTNNNDSTLISLGANQIYDVFYSFTKGEILKLERSKWDIALSAQPQSATIRINDGAGIKLYCVAGINDWANVTEAMAIDDNQLFNSASNWEIGAFNANASFHPNYGWGTYNGTTHDVVGDSVFLIKFNDDSFKKFMIEKRIASTHEYQLKWADIDGSNEVSKTIDPDQYADQLFIYYSLSSGLITDKIPSANWDLLFTSYSDLVPMGPGLFSNYTVTGVLINPAVKVAKVSGFPVKDAKYTDSESGFKNEANSIGYSWKSFNRETNLYELESDLSYFVLNADSVLYQIYFTDYTGTSGGDISFKSKKVE